MKITFAAQPLGKSAHSSVRVGDKEIEVDTRTPQEKRRDTRAANLQKEKDEAAALEAKGLMQFDMYVYGHSSQLPRPREKVGRS